MAKVIVAHPFKQHSFKLATALNERDMLYAYVTTVYDKPQSLMGIVKKILRADNLKKANTRKCKEIPDSKVILLCQLRGYITLATNRFIMYPNFTRYMQRKLYNSFGKSLARYAIKNNVDTVVLYDMTAGKCFKILKRKCPSIKLVLDMSACTQQYTKSIYEQDMQKTNSDFFKKVRKDLWNKRILTSITEELYYADEFLVASELVKKSLIFCGIDDKKIHIAPYGKERVGESKKADNIKKSLKLVFVGHVDYRKGIHHLVNIMKNYSSNEVELTLVGGIDKSGQLYKDIEKLDNIRAVGFITKDKLNKYYLESDIFIFPTMLDGFGFAVIEAMSCGLPVICTDNTGAKDSIIDGSNGFIVPTGDENVMKEKIDWCINNREKLYDMGQEAKRSVECYSWENYNKMVCDILK